MNLDGLAKMYIRMIFYRTSSRMWSSRRGFVLVQYLLIVVFLVLQLSKCSPTISRDLNLGRSRGARQQDEADQEDHRRTRSSLVVPRVDNKTSATSSAITSNSSTSFSLESKAKFANSSSSASRSANKFVRIQVTAIHVDKAEFPLSKLLFKLTLRLALEAVTRQLEQRYQQQQQQQQQQQVQPPRHRRTKVSLSVSVRSANTCSRQFASAVAAEEYYKRRARLFIVSGCDDAIRAVARLASVWRVPVMTAAGFGADLDDKKVHRTLIRVAFSLKAAVEFLFKIMRSFQWRRINLIVDESDANSLALKGSIQRHLNDYKDRQVKSTGDNNNNNNNETASQVNINTISFDLQALMRQQTYSSPPPSSSSSSKQTNETTALDDKWPNELTDRTIQDALRQSSMFSKVNILLIPQQYLRKFMLSVYDENMANGLYTFINMPLLLAASDEQIMDVASGQSVIGDSPSASNYSGVAAAAGNRHQSYTSSTGENVFVWRSLRSSRNSHARQAFESLMSIYLRTPTSKAYVYFVGKLTSLANTDYATTARPSLSSSSSSSPSSSSSSSSALLTTGHGHQAKVQLNINPYSASFYDCLMIYSIALAESLAANIDSSSNGRDPRPVAVEELHANISELIRDRRFENMLTGLVAINSNGDRETDYTLDDMNQMTGRYAPVMMYRAETRDMERLGRVHWSSDPSVGPTTDSVDCNLTGMCASRPRSKFVIFLSVAVVPLALVLGSLFYFVHTRLSLESRLVEYWWKIHLNEIEIVMTRRKNANDGSLIMSGGTGGGPGAAAADSSLVSSSHFGAGSSQLRIQIGTGGGGGGGGGGGSGGGGSGSVIGCDKTTITKATDTTGMASSLDVCYGNITLGIYKLAKVALKPISKFHQSRKLMIELRTIKDINHSNLCRFVGIVVDEASLAIVTEFCPKGSLREFFHNESMVIDWTFKYSIINDIIAGLCYLHSSQLGFHGRLKSSNCLVSGRFVVKLSDYGPHSLYEQIDADEQQDCETSYYKKSLWLAPEHLKSGARTGSMKGDIYSFGLLLYEIITNKLPFYSPEKDDYSMPLKTLYHELKSNGPSSETGPDLGLVEAVAVAANQLADDEKVDIQPLVELMQTCWRFEAAKRPSSMVVATAVKKITRGITSKKLLENLTSRMEQYTNNLESLVEAKLATLVEEKLKTEELLYQFVPRSIASMLKEGQTVEPEAFDCVTVFYSDIVGFTSLSSESSPMEVVDFLSDLYLCFDETLEQHDIFKVDTIGDAYIVASGLPKRNDGKHVVEIATAALELRDRLREFKIPHKPDRALEMRVGIHSGPCIAGIVGGLNMPKYCVFGDTLTTGKFMESNGLPMKIHVTEESRRLLDGVAGFVIEPRTPKIAKDGLPFQTYWLERAA